MKKIVIIVVLLAVVAGGAAWLFGRGDAKKSNFRTETVTRGDLLISINATGTVEPEEVIDVGAQVAGLITSFGKDADGKSIDYGSRIEEGTVLANIDTSLYAADLAQARAQVEQAKAGLQRAQADRGQFKAKLEQAQRDWERAQKIGASEALSQSQFDAYKSAFAAAQANLAVGDAAIEQAKANIDQAQATQQKAQRNLNLCTIVSPVKGVIIDRRVNIGQTVVSSLNAPSLFLIAKDLNRMQVWVAVNEADIGKIKVGMPVHFTVDAFPGEVFRGQVGKVRLNATMTQNVVTYTIEVLTDNSNGKLLPYLTANVSFELQEINDALLVPNAALRWSPKLMQIAPEYREQMSGQTGARMVSSGDAPAGPQAAATVGENGPGRRQDRQDAGMSGSAGATREGADRGMIWVPEGEFVKPIRVRNLGTDGINTVVAGEGVTEGLTVITGEMSPSMASAQGVSPFTPQMPRPPRGSGMR